MASACHGTRRHIFCIDSFEGNDSDFVSGKNQIAWEGNDFLGVFDANLRGANLRQYVTPLRGLSHQFAKAWCEPLDLLFIDASHQYDDVLRDVRTFVPHVKPGGWVALHDVTPGWPDVFKVWNEHVAPTLVEHGAKGSLAYGRKPGTVDAPA